MTVSERVSVALRCFVALDLEMTPLTHSLTHSPTHSQSLLFDTLILSRDLHYITPKQSMGLDVFLYEDK